MVEKISEYSLNGWRRNIFLVPSGRSGNNFIIELSKLYQAFGDNSSLHSIAFTACSVMQVLLLQKPHAKSKSKEHSICLERRLALWRCGDIASLLKEGKCIQDHLTTSTNKVTRSSTVTRHFDHLMSMGKVSAAVKLLSQSAKGDVLSLDTLVPCGVDRLEK